jgi:hypothetical protein
VVSSPDPQVRIDDVGEKTASPTRVYVHPHIASAAPMLDAANPHAQVNAGLKPDVTPREQICGASIVASDHTAPAQTQYGAPTL